MRSINLAMELGGGGLMQAVLARELRANPKYELVLFNRLAEAERRALASLAAEPGFYGVLRPRPGTGLGIKSVDCDTALLYLTLGQPGALPSYVQAALGEGAARTVAQLIADSILEIERGGAFVSGAAAFDWPREAGADQGGGRLADLSRAALRYAQNLAIDDPLQLSFRLYGYNRRPLTPAWRRRLPAAPAVRRYLGIAAGGAHQELLAREWVAGAPAGGWMSWSSARPRQASPGSGATYKLYVSPVTEQLGESFGLILAALTAVGARHFKVGADAGGLLRPDKIVAYFPDFERLAEAANGLAERLRGVAAQGVPFTSEIAGDGLLSWGVDPPASESRLPWNGKESWRLWLTHCLARALLDARASGAAADGGEAGVEPWRFAVERLRLDGVDTDTWTPRGGLWREA
jgi:hypothetical protein